MISFLICLALLIGGYFLYGKVVENTFGPDDRETPAVRNSRRLFADFLGICRDAEGLPDGTTLAPIRGLFVVCFCSARLEI